MIADLDVHPRVNDVAALSDRVFLAATSAGLLRTSDGGRDLEAAVRLAVRARGRAGGLRPAAGR